MTNLRLTLLLLASLAWGNVYADSWEDPEWLEMLEASDLIARITYIEKGTFDALAIVSTVYAGTRTTDTILVYGFSNRYGPIDSVAVGDSFIVFLRKQEWSDETLTYYEERAREDLSYRKFLAAHRRGRLYAVWSPTAGDYRIENDSVAISFLRTTYWGGDERHALPAIEAFLRNRTDPAYQADLLARLTSSPDTHAVATGLLQLAYGRYGEFREVFRACAQWRSDEINYGLSQVLRGIETPESADLLFTIFDDSSDWVRGRIVTALREVGPATPGLAARLSEKLRANFQFDRYQGSLMNPVLNTYRGGGLELIYFLAELHYAPDEGYIVDLVKAAENEALFDAGIAYLDSVRSTRIPEIVLHHFAQADCELFYDVVSLGTRRQYPELLPPLMNYLDTFDRSGDHYAYFLLSTYNGIGAYEGDTVAAFIQRDLGNYLASYRTLEEMTQERYLREYAELLAEKPYSFSKEALYGILRSWYGLDRSFHDSTQLAQAVVTQRVAAQLNDTLADDSLRILSVLPVLPPADGTDHYAPAGYDLLVETKHQTPNTDSLRSLILRRAAYPIDKVYFQRNEGFYFSGFPERFTTDSYEPMIQSFLQVLERDWDERDLNFVRNITRWPILAKEEYVVEQLLQFVAERR